MRGMSNCNVAEKEGWLPEELAAIRTRVNLAPTPARFGAPGSSLPLISSKIQLRNKVEKYISEIHSAPSGTCLVLITRAAYYLINTCHQSKLKPGNQVKVLAASMLKALSHSNAASS